jgi:hypothetical protein
VACLLYFNIAIWDFRDDPLSLDNFLKDLSIQFVKKELDWNNSVETLLWICLLADDQFGSEKLRSQRLWFVGRMLRAVKRVDGDTWLKIRELLLGFLALSDPVEDKERFLWDEDEVRRAILGDFGDMEDVDMTSHDSTSKAPSR